MMRIRLIEAFALFLLVVAPAVQAQQVYREGPPPGLKGVAETVTLPKFSELAKQLSPSVVNISVEGDEEEAEDPQSPRGPLNPYRSLGSGFLVSEDGYIVTSNHVIEKSDQIRVRLLDDKQEYNAKVIGKDKKTDLALLKIEPKGKFSAAYLGDSDLVEVGDWVLAIGNQFELGQTVTAGIVSAKSRRVPSKAMGPYDQFIQTDASINPGSSGGPLFNARGEVIGVNTAIFTPNRGQFGGTGFNIGIGFAIPVNLVKQVVSQLKTQGRVTRGLLGVLIQKVDEDLAEAMGLPTTEGALVAEVVPESPAGRAGILPRDVVTHFDGKQIREYEDLPLMVANAKVGASVAVQVLRAGEAKDFQVKIEELKEDSKTSEKKSSKPDRIGVTVEAVPHEIAAAYKLASGEGVIVTSVEPGSAAERAGVVAGDVVLEISGSKVAGEESYRSLVQALSVGKAAPVVVRKRDGNRFLAIRLREPSKDRQADQK